jgi:curved DNA-binding protein CbpA
MPDSQAPSLACVTVRAVHPDKFDGGHAAFLTLQAAHSTLSDPKARAAHDRSQRSERRQDFTHDYRQQQARQSARWQQQQRWRAEQQRQQRTRW